MNILNMEVRRILMKIKNNRFRVKKNLGLTSTKRKNKKDRVKQQKQVLSREQERVKNLLQCLEEGNLTPIKNYLRSKLPKKKSNKTYSSIKASTEFREENIINETPSEKRVKFLLRKLKIRFTRQQIVHYDKGKFYIMDFYIPSRKLCIEVDGKYHEDEKQKELDSIRTKNLNKMNIEVVRYTNEETENPLFEEDIKMLLHIN